MIGIKMPRESWPAPSKWRRQRPETLVCDNNHGCDGIPITRAMSGALQRTDPRCKNPPVSAEDAAALAQLGAIVKALAAAKAAGAASEPAGSPKP
jgi:hypothetical protein